MDLHNLINAAKEYRDANPSGGYDRWDPPEGTYTAEAIMARTGETKNGKASVGIMCKVIGGAYDGKTFWVNAYLGGGQSPAADAISLELLEHFGVTADILTAYGLDKIEDVVQGQVVPLKVKHKKSGDRTFVNFYPTKAESAAPTSQGRTASVQIPDV